MPAGDLLWGQDWAGTPLVFPGSMLLSTVPMGAGGTSMSHAARVPSQSECSCTLFRLIKAALSQEANSLLQSPGLLRELLLHLQLNFANLGPSPQEPSGFRGAQPTHTLLPLACLSQWLSLPISFLDPSCSPTTCLHLASLDEACRAPGLVTPWVVVGMGVGGSRLKRERSQELNYLGL